MKTLILKSLLNVRSEYERKKDKRTNRNSKRQH